MNQLRKLITGIVRESLNENADRDVIYRGAVTEAELDKTWYHGIPGIFAFYKFNPQSIGTGVVSSGTKYKGFFFTSELENAEYYGEYLICEVKIRKIYAPPSDVNSKNPVEVMKRAAIDKKNYIVNNVLDGSTYSDIVTVPISNINQITITKWSLVGDKESYWDSLNEFFFGDDDEYRDQSIVDSMLHQMELDIDSQLQIPEFSEWYNAI